MILDWIRRLDWRVTAVIIAAAISVLATLAVYASGYGLDPATHFGGVFASWVGGLALFVVAGVVVAIVSLARPEDESFDARARILFRRQTGKHIDYIVAKIKEALEHYAETTVTKISVRAFHPGEKKYRISSSSDVKVRSYLDDVETTYSSHLSLSNVTAPPQGGEANRLAFIRVSGDAIGGPEDFLQSVTRPISCRIKENGVCDVSSMTEFWIKADDEPNTHKPKRYTQTLRLHFENLLPGNSAVEIKLTTDGTNWTTLRLAPGASKQAVEIKDIPPGTQAYDYRVLAP